MARVRAAILAAGRGVRMGGAEPKTLLPIGGREPILFHILSGLKLAGVDDVLVVTGFKPNAIQGYIDSHFADLDVTYVFNARFASWGNFHSVRVALDQSPGRDLLVVNSDIVIHPDVYKRVLATDGDLILAVQIRDDLDAEDMRVHIEGDSVRAISKRLDMRTSAGEFAGVSLLRPSAAEAYARLATDLEWSAQTHGYYEDVYDELMRRSRQLFLDIRFAEVAADEYAEVDEPDDIERALTVLERHGDAFETGGGPEREEPNPERSDQPEEAGRP